MLRPPPALRPYMEGARIHRLCPIPRNLYGVPCAEMEVAREQSRAILARLRALREGERGLGVR